MTWLILTTRPNRERAVAKMLLDSGHSSWIPCEPRLHIGRRARSVRESLLWPRHVLVRPADGPTSALLVEDGVSAMYGPEGRLDAISDSAMVAFMAIVMRNNYEVQRRLQAIADAKPGRKPSRRGGMKKSERKKWKRFADMQKDISSRIIAYDRQDRVDMETGELVAG